MSFSRETTVKAVRKRHRCNGCQGRIEIGEPAMRWAGMTDGDFGAVIYHLDCRAAEIAFNDDILGHTCGDDWYPLHEIDSDDRPWLIETYPAIAARMGITAAKPKDGTARPSGTDPGSDQIQTHTEGQ